MEKPKQNGTYVMSRTMYCETCAKAGRPDEGQLVVVFGHEHQTCFIRKVGRVPRKLVGFTPHIISFDSVCLEAPYVGYIKAVICCGVCGVHITKKENGKMDIEFIKSKYVFFNPNEWAALKNKWKNTGYEL
jgi:hypothetical protein